MNFGQRDELRMELRRNFLKGEILNLELYEDYCSETIVDMQEIMRLYNMEGREKDTKVQIELDLDLFQMEHNHRASLLP